MKNLQLTALFCLILTLVLCPFADASGVRIKDICTYEGVRDNQLIGYGLVVGLEGTGDDDGTGFTQQSLVAFMRNHNIKLDLNNVDVDNVAGVVVTATLPPFAKPGQKIDIRVSSIGNAENLHGGTLLATPLRPVSATSRGAIYAVAQGAISTGGFAAGDQGGTSVVKNHPTVGLIPNGAIVEREVRTAFSTKAEMVLQLRNPDFTTAQRVARIINANFGSGVATAKDSASVSVKLPSGNTNDRVEFLASIEDLQVSPDSPARVVYNENTGTIVMGANVRISTAIITHGNLIFERQDQTTNVLAQQSGPFGQSQTQIQDESTSIQVTEEKGEFKVIDEGVTIGEVARALNALGVSARDIIAILQALKQCGALQAELVAM